MQAGRVDDSILQIASRELDDLLKFIVPVNKEDKSEAIRGVRTGNNFLAHRDRRNEISNPPPTKASTCVV
jgi:hypothetical protein